MLFLIYLTAGTSLCTILRVESSNRLTPHWTAIPTKFQRFFSEFYTAMFHAIYLFIDTNDGYLNLSKFLGPWFTSMDFPSLAVPL